VLTWKRLEAWANSSMLDPPPRARVARPLLSLAAEKHAPREDGQARAQLLWSTSPTPGNSTITQLKNFVGAYRRRTKGHPRVRRALVGESTSGLRCFEGQSRFSPRSSRFAHASMSVFRCHRPLVRQGDRGEVSRRLFAAYGLPPFSSTGFGPRCKLVIDEWISRAPCPARQQA